MKVRDKLFSYVKAIKPSDRSFEAFKKRFHTILGDKLELTGEQLKEIYDGILPYIETSIYAEMEDVLASIRNAFQAVNGWVREDTAKAAEIDKNQSTRRPNVRRFGGHKSFSLHKQPNDPETEIYQKKGDSSKNEAIQRYMNHKASFNRFVTHIVTNYQSAPKHRIERLMFKLEGYQSLESHLFNEPFIKQYGFKKAYDFHNELMKAFYTTFDNLLFKGTTLKSDQAIKEQVLAPVLEQFKARIDAYQVGDEHEQADPL